MWSTVAASSATLMGLVRGSTCTASPILMRLVRIAMALAIGMGDDNTERAGSKWCSASHTESKPDSSAMSIWAIDSWKASCWVIPCLRKNSAKSPKSISSSLG